jgi:DNA-binding NarL/FixJ family response regulator
MRSCLICDDHALMRDALAMTVAARWPEAEIGTASTYPEAWSRSEAQPDLCLVDLVMPGATEREGVRELRARAPDAKLIVVTGSHDDELLLELLRSDIAGFVPKTSASEIIVAAIELALAGGRYLPPRVAELADRAGERPKQPNQPGTVTPRQRRILELVAEGMSNKEIARTLDISPSTVKTHVAQAIAMMGGANRTDAAVKLLRETHSRRR